VPVTPGSSAGMGDDAVSEPDVAGLLRDHDGPLRAYLARRLRNRHEVDDYVQDVYVRVLSSRSTKKVESWRGLLLRIASNLLIDRKRRDTVRRRDDHIPVEAEGDLLDENGHSPERTLLAKEELATLSQALEALDPRVRTVFLAVRVEGLSLREAGARVGVDDKAAARMVERAVALAARSLLKLDEGTL
jgi:RNA polymerase sigma factor (sigma-70 family)